MNKLPETYNFFEHLTDVHGKEAAQEIGEVLFGSMRLAQEELPLRSPIAAVKVIARPITETSGAVYGFAYSRQGNVYIVVNTLVSDDQVKAELPSVVIHEIAHVAHADNNRDMFYFDRHPRLQDAVIEGVARHASSSLLDPSYEACEVPLYYEEDMPRVPDILAELAHNPAYSDQIGKQEFMGGDDSFPHCGYVAGHVIVGGLVACREYDMERLMKTPIEEFRDFIKEYV